MIVSPASSTDIAFTGKGPRSPRLKWLGYITFWKWRSPSTGKVKYIWYKILYQVYQWINIFLYLINCLYVHTFIVFCISAIVGWFLAWINLGNGPELSLQFLRHFPFPLFHIWKREQIGPRVIFENFFALATLVWLIMFHDCPLAGNKRRLFEIFSVI